MPPIDLAYWRSRLAAQAHSGSPHVGLTTAQFAEILDELEAARKERDESKRSAAGWQEIAQDCARVALEGQ